MTTYDYLDADGTLVHQTVRKTPKGFSQRRPDPRNPDGWIWNLQDIQPVLYRLPQLLTSTDIVLCCEGERDADRLADMGYIATTNPMGAGKWRDHYGQWLKDRDVVILPDNDDPGEAHANQVAQALSGTARSIKIVNLPGIPPKGDVSDFLDTSLAKDFDFIIESTPLWIPKFEPKLALGATLEPPSSNTSPPSKSPLFNEEAERALLIGILTLASTIEDVADYLRPVHFYEVHNQKIYEAMLGIWLRSERVDFTTVSNELRGSPALQQLNHLIEGMVDNLGLSSSFGVKDYGQIVFRLGLTRMILDVLRKDGNAGAKGEVLGEDLLHRVISDLDALGERQIHQDYEHISEVMARATERLQQLHEGNEPITGIPSGYADLDAFTHGFQRKDLIYLAARPSMGKSSLAMNITSMLAAQGIGVGFFSLEMSSDQLGDRLVSLAANVDSEHLRTGQMNLHDWSRTQDGITQVAGMPIWIDDSKIDLIELRTKAKRMVSRNAVQIIFVDYIGLMMDSSSRVNEQQELSSLSRGLKGLAKELDIPLVVLSQLNRDADGVEPELRHLRSSGSLEQDADLVIMPYRPGYWDAEVENPNLCELFIRKHRNGPTGSIYLFWIGEQMRFVEVKDVEAPF